MPLGPQINYMPSKSHVIVLLMLSLFAESDAIFIYKPAGKETQTSNC